MIRNCVVAVIAWVALLVIYGIVLFRESPGPLIFLIASGVWVGLVLINASRYSLRDWRARNRMARGERPQNGELVAATGTIRPFMEPLIAPFTGRECVVYSYNVGPSGTRRRDNPAKDYSGFAMTRCSVHTPYGSFALGSFPTVDGLPAEHHVDRARAAEYIGTTQFTRLSGMRELVNAMIALYSAKPPIRYDWQISEPDSEPATAAIEERVVEVGKVVTVFGRYDSASSSIVTDTKEKGFLRLRPGGNPREVSSFPGEAAAKFLVGLLLAAGPNVALWLYFGGVGR